MQKYPLLHVAPLQFFTDPDRIKVFFSGALASSKPNGLQICSPPCVLCSMHKGSIDILNRLCTAVVAPTALPPGGVTHQNYPFPDGKVMMPLMSVAASTKSYGSSDLVQGHLFCHQMMKQVPSGIQKGMNVNALTVLKVSLQCWQLGNCFSPLSV